MSDKQAISHMLQVFMAPLSPFMQLEGVNEICVNEPGTVWVEQFNRFQSYKVPSLDRKHLEQWVNLIAEFNQKEITPETPLLSAMLPDGARAQVVIPPACDNRQFIVSIRRQAIMNLSLDDYVENGAFGDVHPSSADREDNDEDRELFAYYSTRQYDKFLKTAVRFHKNIIISGGTNTGKSTFLNAHLKEIALSERIITIETQREVLLDHPNTVHLLACDGSVSQANVTMLDCLKTTLRLRPDRIFLSEIRGEEAFPYLRAINSGHPGSITTLHADSPAGCFDQLAFMVLQGGTSLTRADIIAYAKRVIDIVVQLKRKPTGERYISEIYYNVANARRSQNEMQPLLAEAVL